MASASRGRPGTNDGIVGQPPPEEAASSWLVTRSWTTRMPGSEHPKDRARRDEETRYPRVTCNAGAPRRRQSSAGRVTIISRETKGVYSSCIILQLASDVWTAHVSNHPISSSYVIFFIFFSVPRPCAHSFPFYPCLVLRLPHFRLARSRVHLSFSSIALCPSYRGTTQRIGERNGRSVSTVNVTRSM